MDERQVITLLLIGVALAVGSMLVRVVSKGKHEIKTIDLVFIIVPLLFVGLALGKLQGVDIFGVKADLTELWAKAAGTEIEQQISTVPVSPVNDAIEMIETAEKRGVNEIPELIRQRTQALAFRLGQGGYDGPAIQKYFDDLYGSSYLRYVVIKRPDDTLFGLFDAVDLIAYLRTLGAGGYDTFKDMLNRGDDRAEAWLAELPGFVAADQAVTATTSKREALQAMDKRKLDSLPVVDSERRFVGTVERSKLTTSLVLAVTRQLTNENANAGN